MYKNYNEWFDEYYNDLINLFKIVLKYEDKVENNNEQFNNFCEFIYKN
jgi:hypothetical protein